jgi:predicted glycogen debranching enzyme
MSDSREWLEADGCGGFAMGTEDGIRTRRYHALLCTATHPPEGRMVLVADLEVFVETSAGRFALSSHRYRDDVIYPDGASRLVSFAWSPWPSWAWALPDGTRISCELVVAKPHVAIKWVRIAGAGAASLSVRPLLAGRDYHSLHHENGAFRFDAEVTGERVTWRPYEGVPAISALANGRYAHGPEWYRNVLLAEERHRGLDHEEDLASPGTLAFDLATGPAALAFSAGITDEEQALPLVERTFAAESVRRVPRGSELEVSADAYVVARGAGHTIIAGYPWFADWGRDTFISLRGLCLASSDPPESLPSRREIARNILMVWSSAVSEGMLPNRFDEHAGSPEYNSVDAALWFVIAADAYLTGVASDPDRRALEHAIDEIVAGYARGTRHRIAADTDGLLSCGVPGLQLTWMDAKVGDHVITPRIGKPVEVQALWLNALAIAGRRTARWRELFERGRASFAQRFWNDGQLYDVIDCDHVPGTVDASFRPNQIFAVGGLPVAIIEGPRARTVIDNVERSLWTVAGPRTLATSDPRYCGRYVGGPRERDLSYHNGPVWPWLAGPFVEAWVRVRGSTAEAKREARTKFLDPLLERLELSGFGHLSEMAEGDPPHRPVGCPFQAWSVAEVLRLDRDVLR